VHERRAHYLAQGKIAREDIAQLAIALLESPEAADTTFEVKSTQPFPEPYKAEPSAPPRDWRVGTISKLCSSCKKQVICCGLSADLSTVGMQAVLQGAKLQKGVTGKTINGRWTGKEPETSGKPEPAVH
jgi:hypothetical protein